MLFWINRVWPSPNLQQTSRRVQALSQRGSSSGNSHLGDLYDEVVEALIFDKCGKRNQKISKFNTHYWFQYIFKTESIILSKTSTLLSNVIYRFLFSYTICINKSTHFGNIALEVEFYLCHSKLRKYPWFLRKCPGNECFAAAGWAVEQNARGRVNTESNERVLVKTWPNHCLR